MDLEGPVVPAHRKLAISGYLPPNNIFAHVESKSARRHGRSSAAKSSADDRRSRRGGRVGVRRRGLDDFAEEGRNARADSEEHVTEAVNRQQAINALEMKERGKVRRKKKCTVARPNDKLVVGARVIYKRKMKDGKVEKYGC